MSITSKADLAAAEAYPLSGHALPATTYEALAASTRRTPDARALSFFMTADSFDRPFIWTYAELLAEVTRAANAFQALGISADHPVAFVLPNLPETHFTIWGGEAAGAVLALNPLLEPGHIAELMRAAGARVLVTVGPGPFGNLWSGLAPHLADLDDLQTIVLVDLAVYTGGARAELPQPPAGAAFRIVDYRAMMQDQQAHALTSPRIIQADTISSYFCTGGTTGLPKIAVRTHGNEVFDAWSAAHLLGKGSGPGQRNFFCGLPLFHVNAQLVTGLLPWMQGDHVVLGTPEGYRSKGLIARFWHIAAHYRVSMFSGVPTIYAALLEVPIGDNDISSVDFGICGAAPMPAKLIEAFEQTTGIKVLEGYGLTEAACVSAVNPAEGQRHPGSIGLRIPYQQMRAAILDETGGVHRWAATDEIGTLVIRGPNVFPGYLDPRFNHDLWITIDGERWLNTGDLGREDAAGYFWLTGRRKELIIRGGHNIDPKMIEECLARHPAVALVAAVGCPDAHAGEVPVAYVQPKPDVAVTPQDLLDFAARHIPERAAIPRQIKLVTALPLTAVGKIHKPTLTLLEIEAVVRNEAGTAGAVVASLVFERDAKGVQVARVAVSDGVLALRKALERYSFKVEVFAAATDLATDLSADLATDLATDLAADLAADLATDLATGLAADLAADLAAEPVPEMRA